MMGKNGEIFQGRSGPNIYMIICEKNVTYTYNMFFFSCNKERGEYEYIYQRLS